MSDSNIDIGVQHRLLGAEDVEWDANCTNEQVEFETPFGVTKPLTKINASHIPLDNATYLALGGPKTVATALQALKSAMSPSGGGASGMGEDTTVAIGASAANAEAVNALISGQDKNLGGHTLTFQFAANTPRSFNMPLLFQDFRDGKVVIDLNGNTLTMGLALADGLFHFVACQATVEIRNGTVSFVGKGSSPAIKGENSLAVHCAEIAFMNDLSSSEAYAFYGLATDCRFTSCTVTNGLFYKGGSKNGSAWNDASGDWISTNKLSEDVAAGIDRLNTLAESWDEDLSASAIVARGYDAETGAHYREYSNGLLVQWGLADVGVYQVNTSNYYFFAAKVRFAASPRKRYSDNGYLAFVQPTCQFDLTPVLGEDGSLQKFTSSLDRGPTENTQFLRSNQAFVPSNLKQTEYFVAIDFNSKSASGIDMPTLPAGAQFEWLTIGTVADSDKASNE